MENAVDSNWLKANPLKTVDPCLDNSPVLFTDFLMDWLKMMKSRVEITTYAGYTGSITKRIVPYSKDFIDVDFKTVGEHELSENKEKLDVLLVQPGAYPQKISIGTDLKDLQDAVGGTITATYPFTDPVAIVCNDEGKLLGLPMNRALRDEHGQTYDVVAGNFLVVGLGEEDFASLSPELAQKYEQFFHQPETFVKLGSHLVILPTPDEAVQPAEEKSHIKPPAEHDR